VASDRSPPSLAGISSILASITHLNPQRMRFAVAAFAAHDDTPLCVFVACPPVMGHCTQTKNFTHRDRCLGPDWPPSVPFRQPPGCRTPTIHMERQRRGTYPGRRRGGLGWRKATTPPISSRRILRLTVCRPNTHTHGYNSCRGRPSSVRDAVERSPMMTSVNSLCRARDTRGGLQPGRACTNEQGRALWTSVPAFTGWSGSPSMWICWSARFLLRRPFCISEPQAPVSSVQVLRVSWRPPLNGRTTRRQRFNQPA